MRTPFLVTFLSAAVLLAPGCTKTETVKTGAAVKTEAQSTPTEPQTNQSPAASVFDGLTLDTLGGGQMTAEDLKDKVVLVVNVASRCGYTGQYAGLQKLYEAKSTNGLVVLGVPCNQFGGQEPGSADDIKAFTKEKFGVTFPLLAKQNVKGGEASPLFQRLMDASAQSTDVRWNFEKFLVGRDGKLIARYGSGTRPGDSELTSAIDQALGGS